MTLVQRCLAVCSASSSHSLSGLVLAAVLLAGCSDRSAEDHLAAGNRLLASGERNGAVIELKSALAANPDLAEARLLLGQVLLDKGDAAGALVELERASALQVDRNRVDPLLARALLRAGETTKLVARFGDRVPTEPRAAADVLTSLSAARGRQGDLQGARELAGRALEATPGFAPAVVSLARMDSADGRHDEGLRRLDELARTAPDDEAAGTLRGEVQWRGKRDAAAARAAWESVLAKHPDAVRARSFLVALEVEQGRLPEARKHLEQLVRVAPADPDALFHRAHLAFLEGDYQASRGHTDLILRVAPTMAPALELAGAAELKLGRAATGQEFLGRALAQAPESTGARRLLAQSLLQTGQPDRALEVLQPALDQRDADATLLTLAGEAHLRGGNLRAAEAAFKRAATAAPADAGVQMASARLLLARGQSAEGLRLLEGAAAAPAAPAAGPADLRADLLLVGNLLTRNDLAGAARAADRLVTKAPESALAHTLRANVLMLRGDFPGAARSFETALARDPGHLPAVAGLAGVDVAQGRRAAARERLQQFVARNPKQTGAWLALAELARSAGATPEDVAQPLREALRADASRPAVHLALVAHWLGAGDARQALAAAQAGAAALPDSTELQDALGRSQLAAGESQQALATFKRLASQHPSDPAVAQRLGDAHLAVRDAEGAARAYARVLQLRPDSPLAQRGLAIAALSQGRPEEARRIAAAAIQKQPGNAFGHGLAGDVALMQRDWPAAIDAYRAAQSRAPATETAVKLHGALLSAGRVPDAQRLADDWLRTRPRDATFLYYLGGVALAQNQTASAESLYRRVLTLQPDNALALNNLAWALTVQGKPGALPLAQRAVQLAPGRAPLLDTLAAALAADKQLDKALDTQRKAAALEPQNPVYKLHMAKLMVQANQRAAARPLLDELAALGERFPRQPEVARLRAGL